jgi:hypothetical protein
MPDAPGTSLGTLCLPTGEHRLVSRRAVGEDQSHRTCGCGPADRLPGTLKLCPLTQGSATNIALTVSRSFREVEPAPVRTQGHMCFPSSDDSHPHNTINHDVNPNDRNAHYAFGSKIVPGAPFHLKTSRSSFAKATVFARKSDMAELSSPPPPAAHALLRTKFRDAADPRGAAQPRPGSFPYPNLVLLRCG